MVKCSSCKGPVPEYGGKLLTIDGAFACSDKCKKKWEADRDHFFNVTVKSEKATEKWLLGD